MIVSQWSTPAGQLDRRITLQQPAHTRDPAYGSEVEGWADVITVWARVIERAAAEVTETTQRVLQRQITVRIRYRAGVLSSWRVLLGGRVLQIQGVLEVGRRQWMDLDCQEVTGG